MGENTITRVYLKRANEKGKAVITDHCVWDLEKFLASQQAEQRKLRDDKKPFDEITIATEAEYRAFAWPKKEAR